jgi:5'-nucleotidase/UDP-sugar diphosphatase
MKKTFKRAAAALLAAVIMISCFYNASAAENADVTILFTHDMHSHLLPAADENGNEYGGYARLKTAIDEQKAINPDALLVDGGDFSMGSLFQTAYSSSAIELRMLGRLGYDTTTLGNHEFDYLPKGLSQMLSSAKNSGDRLPEIVLANYKPKDKFLKSAFSDFGIKDYKIIKRGGIYFAVFGIFGFDSDECAPNSVMKMSDPIKTAQATANKAIKYCKKKYGAKPVVVCLSHSGTENGKGEDYELASQTEGIDVIISAHSHTTLEKPIVVGDTYIVSASEYCKNLGVLNLERTPGGKLNFKSYNLIPINSSIKEDRNTEKVINNFKKTVEKDYLKNYNMKFDEILINNSIKFDTVDEVYATQHESTLGNVFSDAYKWAVEEATGETVDVALTAAGVIRESLPQGEVSVSDVFNAASLGVGTEGELIAVYLTGKDLKNALEVDASVQPMMSSAQLFFSGIEYSFNTNRMIFNKVDYAALRRGNKTEKIDDDKLYRIVTGMYCGQMLGAVKEKSFGLLSITPRDKNGNPITQDEFANYIVKTESGENLKEWYAIASYLKDMGGSMNESYSKADGRKVVYSSFAPADMLRGANIFTFAVIIAGAVIILVVVLITRKIAKKRKTKK